MTQYFLVVYYIENRACLLGRCESICSLGINYELSSFAYQLKTSIIKIGQEAAVRAMHMDGVRIPVFNEESSSN